MTTHGGQLRRLKWTFVLFGIAMIAIGLSYQSRAQANRHTDDRVNALVCVTKPYIEAGRARSMFNVTHGATAQARAQAVQQVTSADQFLSGLITSPKHFDCAPFLKKLLKEAQHDEH